MDHTPTDHALGGDTQAQDLNSGGAQTRLQNTPVSEANSGQNYRGGDTSTGSSGIPAVHPQPPYPRSQTAPWTAPDWDPNHAEASHLRDIEMEWLSTDAGDLHPMDPTSADLEGPAFGPVSAGKDGWLIKDSTAAQYTKVATRLWRLASIRKAHMNGDFEAPALVTPSEVVDYLIARARPQDGLPAFSQNTWNSYRSALLWELSKQESAEFAQALKRLEDITVWPRRHGDQAVEGAEALAANNRKRGIPKADLARLVDHLGQMNRHRGWGARVQWWLEAAIATGLRPGEWEFTRWADSSHTLLLAPTYKAKADTPAAMRRGLKKSDLATTPAAAQLLHETPTRLSMRAIPVDPSDKIYVQQHLQSIEQAAEEGVPFKAYHEYCRQTLWRACKQLWGNQKAYALYQARHQFSANSRGKLSRQDLAAVMGHSLYENRARSGAKYAGASMAHRTRKGGMTPGDGRHQTDALTQAMQGMAAARAWQAEAGASAATPGNEMRAEGSTDPGTAPSTPQIL